MTEYASRATLDALRDLRADINDEARDLYARWQPQIGRRGFCVGAFNLACYLALRRRDLRALQSDLTALGLSSLGRSEARVLPNLDAAIATLERVHRLKTPHPYPPARAHTRGARLLTHETDIVFGVPDVRRRVRIMVTFPSEAASDYTFVRDLVARGMDAARINCAHDTPDDWSMMIAHVKRAAVEIGRPVKIHMDLGGPKPRTADVWLRRKDERVHLEDRLWIGRRAPDTDTDGSKFGARFRCTIPEVLEQLAVGHAVWIDDGKIGARVEEKLPDGVIVRVTHARAKGERLRAEKGLNFPDTDVDLSALTDDDLTALDFVVPNADLIGYSFVQTADDVARLHDEIARRMSARRMPHPAAIIAKIETRRAIRNLPDIIVSAAGRAPFGVMIARGDLGVEVGYERMAEIQEELLWLCEAAYVPVIWATEVLERFVGKGTPSRSEMTDAAMSVRAECVMLNKGEYVRDAVTILDNVLRRMQGHQTKKTPTLRALRAWAETI
jgi:pyruvate kinase